MNFKELKKGFPVYILNKESLLYSLGKVVLDATPPRMNTIFGLPMLTDVSIESEGQIKIWTLPADLLTAEMLSDSNIVIATDKVPLVSILKSIESECQTYLDGVENCLKRLDLAKGLVAELDVVYKLLQLTEERFVRIEQSIGGIESTLSQILKAVNNGH